MILLTVIDYIPIEDPQIVSHLNIHEFLFIIVLTIIVYFKLQKRRNLIPVTETETNDLNTSWSENENRDVLMQTKNPVVVNNKLPFANFSAKKFYLHSLGVIACTFLLFAIYFEYS